MNRIGYSATRLTGNGVTANSDGTPIDRDTAVRLPHSAFEQGVNHIDTAVRAELQPVRRAAAGARPSRSLPGLRFSDAAPRLG